MKYVGVASCSVIAVTTAVSLAKERKKNGAYVNLEYPLMNGSSVRFLKDEDIYFGNQVERVWVERCYGVVVNEAFILVCEYGCNGSDPEIVLYKRR